MAGGPWKIFQTYVAPNKLPNWKRIHEWTFLSILVFRNELPNWRKQTEKKNEKQQAKNQLAPFIQDH